jgi:hypothetical protein
MSLVLQRNSFYGNVVLKACQTLSAKDLVDLFRREVFKILKTEGKITNFHRLPFMPSAKDSCYQSEHLTSPKFLR